MRMTSADQRRELWRLNLSLALEAASNIKNFGILDKIQDEVNKKMNIFMGPDEEGVPFKIRIDVKKEKAIPVPLNAHTEACLIILYETTSLGGVMQTEKMDEQEYILSDSSISDRDKHEAMTKMIAKSPEFDEPID